MNDDPNELIDSPATPGAVQCRVHRMSIAFCERLHFQGFVCGIVIAIVHVGLVIVIPPVGWITYFFAVIWLKLWALIGVATGEWRQDCGFDGCFVWSTVGKVVAMTTWLLLCSMFGQLFARVVANAWPLGRRHENHDG